MSAAIASKPADVTDFACEYFANLRLVIKLMNLFPSYSDLIQRFYNLIFIFHLDYLINSYCPVKYQSTITVDNVSIICTFFVCFTCNRKEQATKAIYPIVFAGPSGVGKGTLINLLMKRYPNLFGFSTSHTTRRPRYMNCAFHFFHENIPSTD